MAAMIRQYPLITERELRSFKPLSLTGALYGVDRNGRVVRLESAQGTRRGKLLTPFLDQHNHYRVKFSLGSQRGQFTRRVDLLVLLAFTGRPEHKPYEIEHIDENESNCALDNLRYKYPEHTPRLVVRLREERMLRLQQRAVAELMRESRGRKRWTERHISVLLNLSVTAVRALRRSRGR